MKLLRPIHYRRPDTNSATVQQSNGLVETARACLAEGRADEALDALRQARTLTPMREDIRQLVEKAVQIRASRRTAPNAKPDRHSATAPPGSAPAVVGSPALFGTDAPAPRKPRRAAQAASSAQPDPPPAAASPPRPVPPANLKLNPTRGLQERRLPSLNLLAWIAIVGVAGIVVIASSAIVQVGTHTLYKRGDERGPETVSKTIPPEVREQIHEARREMAAAEPLRAVARLQLALDRWPDEKESLAPVLAEAYAARGEQLRKADSPERAAEAFDNAATLAPADPFLRVAQGESLFAAARAAQDRRRTTEANTLYAAAVVAYAKALALAPGNPAAALGQAKVHAARNERQEAVRLCRDVTRNHPGSPQAAEAERMLKMLVGNP